MADSCFMSLESEVFDDQIVPDTDDCCFLSPSEPHSNSANVSLRLSGTYKIFVLLIFP